MSLAVVDFETGGIEKRPVYPPPPVGFAEHVNGKSKYWAWGHPCENNCTKAQAQKRLKELFRDYSVCFHNAAFDISVAINYMGCKLPASYHDTLFLAYLFDPREPTLSLKPLSDKFLNMPPDEQVELRDWILLHVLKGKKATKKSPWGKFIAYAPGKLVGKYAIGDVVRTAKLFDFYMPMIKEMGMEEAYQRELDVMPIFEEMSSVGLKIRTSKLKKDLRSCEKQHKELEAGIKRRLGAKDLLITSGVQLADAMERKGLVDEWVLTEKGNRSTSRENLGKCCNDKELVAKLSRFGVLSTYINTFMHPWLASAEKYGGRVYPNFNQVRSPDEHGSGSFGTRTGRPSSNNPNLFNVPKNVEAMHQWQADLPWVRDYIAPDDGMILNSRDYSQQEIRVLAHFEEGQLLREFNRDPTLDAHDIAMAMIKQVTGMELPRKAVKVLAFGIIYGMGAPALSLAMGCSEKQAATFKRAYLTAFPGVEQLNSELKKIGWKDEAIRTWGGRMYYVEEPAFVGKSLRTFEYKLMNYLIQGSAADMTKTAMIQVNQACSDSRIMLQVYDEILCSSGNSKEMALMREAMGDIKIDVPMKTDGASGRVSWAQLEKCA